MSTILTLNAGSSSVKFSVNEQADEPQLIIDGQVENLGPVARLILETDPKLVKDIGGAEFNGPAVLDDAILAHLAALNPLAPLHQPHNLSMVAAARQAFPDAMQIGCFDTAFHHGHPWVNNTFAIPRKYYDEGVRRYGFHGLSYDYITGTLRDHWPALETSKVVICHLGNGASMCAIRNGRSIGSSMGYLGLSLNAEANATNETTSETTTRLSSSFPPMRNW